MENLAAFGLKLDESESEDESYEVWSENWPVLRLFMACGTQWSVDGQTGTTLGLRYEAMPMMFDAYGLPAASRAGQLDDLQECERAALEAWRARRG